MDEPRGSRSVPASPWSSSGPDRERLRRASREFLRALRVVEDPAQVEASAQRIADAWSIDLLEGYRVDPASLLTPFPSTGNRGMVLIRDVEFTSFCVHHLLPFFGSAHLAYLPGEKLTGLSKLARLVEVLSRRLQIQERLTHEIVGVMDAALAPRGVAAMVEAEHLCMTARGVRGRGARIVTTAWSGSFLTEGAERRAFLDLLGTESTR